MRMNECDPPSVTAFLGYDQNAALAATLAMADGIGASLAAARGLLLAGRKIDLGGLDDLCGRLCARSLDLPPEQGRLLAPRLDALRDGLDATTRIMGGKRDP